MASPVASAEDSHQAVGPDLSTVGKRLRYARVCRRYTRNLVRKYAKIEPEWLSAREWGQLYWPLEVVLWLSWLYEIPARWALYGTGEVPCFQTPSPCYPRPEERLRKRWGKRPGPRALKKLLRGSDPPLVLR